MVGRIAVFLAFLAISVSFWVFRVDQTEKAILFRLGEIQRSDFAPGLHLMIPIYHNVRTFDARMQTLESEPQRFLTGEKKELRVDSFIKWRVRDVEVYYRATGGNPRRAGSLIYQRVNDGLRSEFGKRTVQEVVSGERGTIMDVVTREANERGRQLGMDIVDVRLKRIDFPEEVSTTVYERMRSERARVAREYRARGDKEAIRITAEADRDRTIIVAEAYRDAEKLRGAGDALASEIYAKAFGEDEAFYDFYRSLTAYRNSFGNRQDVLLLAPDSEFFKFFKSSTGR